MAGLTTEVSTMAASSSTLGSRQPVRGSPAEFRQLLAAVDNQTWTPVIDSVRPLGDAAAAHEREENGLHFGKLVLDCQ
jgi:NADPH:quinone reductase-like Zn-dependent oxidoreductase